MLEYTQEELDALAAAGIEPDLPDANALTAEEQAALDSLDPELQALFARNPELDPDATTPRPDGSVIIPGLGRSDDVTDAVREANRVEDSSRLTKDNLYGKSPGIIPFTKALALKDDMIDLFNADAASTPSSAQKTAAAHAEAVRAFRANADTIYAGTPGVMVDGQKIYTRYFPDKPEERIIVPTPKSIGFERVVGQAASTMYQELGGFFTEGAVTKESELAIKTPDYELGGGEQFLSDMLSLTVPILVAEKAVRGTRYLGRFARGLTAGKKTQIASNTVASSFVEAVMSGASDEGWLFKPDQVKGWTKGVISDDEAASVALFMDGMFLNGLMDGVVALASSAWKFTSGKLIGVKKLANKEALKAATETEVVQKVLNYLDPELASLPPEQFKRRALLLAEKLNTNSIINLKLGDATAAIPADTTIALMNSSEAYVREVHQTALANMTADQAETYVQKEAARMSSAMISIMRSQSANPIVSNATREMADNVGGFLTKAADENLPVEMSVDQAAQTTAQNLARNKDLVVRELTDEASSVIAQTDDLLRSQATVLESNPIVQDLLGLDVPIFSIDNNQFRKALDNLVADKVYPEFVRTMDAVDAAYKNLPPAEIDAELLLDKLKSVVEAANDFDGTGNKAKVVLQDIFAGFNPRKKATEALPDTGFRPFGFDKTSTPKVGVETADEILDRINEGVTFKDLYEIKANLSRVIDGFEGDPRIQQRLREFRDHITDPDSGQMRFVLDNADPEVAAAYRSADQLYKDAKATFSNSAPIRLFEKAMADQRRFRDQEMVGNFGRNEPDVLTGGSQLIDQAMADNTDVLMRQLEFMVRDVMSPEELSEPFKKLFVAKGVDALRTAMIAAGDTPQSEQMLLNAFLPVRDQLKKLGATDVLDQLDTAVSQIRSARGNLGDIKLEMDEVFKNIDASIREAENDIVSRLISPEQGRTVGLTQGPSLSVARSDARTVLSGILKGPDGANNAQSLLNKIAMLPVDEQKLAQQALQSVALDTIGSQVFGSSPVALVGATKQAKNINLGTVSKLSTDEASNIMKSINVLYGNDANMGEAVRNVLDTLYDISTPDRMKLSLAGSDTAILSKVSDDVRDAVSTGILLTAGYMNPTAAMLRRIASVPVNEAQKLQKEVAANVLAVIVSDPIRFSQMINLAVTVKDTAILKNAAYQVVAAAARTARYDIRVNEEDNPSVISTFLDDQMESMTGN